MRAIFRNLVIALFGAVLSLGFYGQEAEAVLKGSGAASSVSAAAYPLLAPDGVVGAPSYSFSSAPTWGLYRDATYGLVTDIAGTAIMGVGGAGPILNSAMSISWNSGVLSGAASRDLFLVRDAANTLAQANSTNAQVNRLYFSTTGPVYWQATARTAGVLYTGTGGAAQVSYAQTTVPTCITNCGTSPSIVGTDTAMRVTMGASGVPASAWVVQFNGTWPAAPVCHVTAALATMVVGKIAIAVVTTTTTLTVTTNGTAPATSDQYQIICLGVS